MIPEELRDYRIPGEDDALLEECTLTAFRSSGPGGQHKNKSATAIRLCHQPSGVVTIGRRERSQRRNLMDALSRLRIKLERLLEEPTPRKATNPPRKSKKKRLNEKRRRSETKRRRGKVTDSD